MDPLLLAVLSGAGGLGAVAGIAVMLPMEAGVPVPIPSDLVMLAVGARVGAGDIPLWVAVLAFEAIAVIGTTALFLAVRGPGYAFITRVGPRVGLSAARLSSASRFLERRGSPALTVGRAVPGLRTVTVVAAGGSGMSPRRALPPLIIGSSIFLQLHLFLGYFLGAAARHALRVATGPAITAVAALVIGAAAFWVVRRGRRAGAGGLLEAACPACVGLALISERPALLDDLVEHRPPLAH